MMMLRGTNRTAVRRSVSAAARRMNTQAPPPPKPAAMGGGSPAGKAPVSPPAPAAAAKPAGASSAPPTKPSGSSGPGVGTLLLLTALSAPAGVAVYLKQNPSWEPEFEVVRKDPNWIKFRELVLGKPATKKASFTQEKQITTVTSSKPTTAPKEFSKTPEELSALISKANPAASLKQPKPSEEPTSAPPAKKKTAKLTKAKAEVAEVPVKKETTPAAPKSVEVIKKKEQKSTATPVAAAPVVVAAVPAPVKEEKPIVEKIVDAAISKERQVIDTLAKEATAGLLGSKIAKQIQSTTKEIVETLQAEAAEAAFDVDKNYLSGIHELDSNALAIRVAQLATEMKHRSKWEAVRLLEALRRIEEDAKKKSAEILARQEQLHKELLERELRLQAEIMTRKTRNELDQLKKQYAEDLSRNVLKEKTAILKSLQEEFAADKKAIEDKFAQQLKVKSESFQATLTNERKQRVQELENYRAELRALNAVLERTSTYEAFSHQVHKASMAALALSDRIEAAGPLRTEIRALQEFARNDTFIAAALQTLPEHVIEEGAPSVSQLQERFKTVKAVGRRAAMVPEGSGLVGQLFGGALSYLIIPPGGPIEGTEPDAVFSRADYAMKAGDIETAVSELKALKGLPAEVSRDWISAAQDRLAVEQTAKVVKAHISLLAASCS